MRRRALTVILWCACGLGLVAAISLAVIGREGGARFIENTLRTEAALRGIRVTTRRFDIFAVGVRATEVEVFVQRLWLSLLFGPSEARLTFFPLRATVALEGYGGRIESTAHPTLFGGPVTGDISARGLQIARHPQLHALGIASGQLDVTASALTLESGNLSRGTFSLDLTDAALPQPLSIRPGQLGLPLGISIPAITDIDARLTGTLDGAHLVLPELKLTSSLGSFTGSARVPRNHGEELILDGLILLTPSGIEQIGPYLAIASGGTIVPDGGKIRLAVRGPTTAPRFRLTRAG